MQKSDLNFQYPEHLVATERKLVSRVMLVDQGEPQEVSLSYILTQIAPGDVLVINETKVIPARVFSEEGLEILFIKPLGENRWEVLCPARRWPKGKDLKLPGGVSLAFERSGRPQIVKSSVELNDSYFADFGEMPLPPYIQEARGERHSREDDRDMYQTAWASELGSLAAPTASLHFSKEDLQKVKNRGADVVNLCLHVGLGTFLPITSENLQDHEMHSEQVFIAAESWQKIQECKANGGKVWALGSTVVRSLESKALRDSSTSLQDDSYSTDLFITPGFDFKVVDVMMTNFHQPESTLIAMVMAFAGKVEVKRCYQWAIEKNFRLFSYGDLSVWKK